MKPSHRPLLFWNGLSEGLEGSNEESESTSRLVFVVLVVDTAIMAIWNARLSFVASEPCWIRHGFRAEPSRWYLTSQVFDEAWTLT